MNEIQLKNPRPIKTYRLELGFGILSFFIIMTVLIISVYYMSLNIISFILISLLAISSYIFYLYTSLDADKKLRPEVIYIIPSGLKFKFKNGSSKILSWNEIKDIVIHPESKIWKTEAQGFIIGLDNKKQLDVMIFSNAAYELKEYYKENVKGQPVAPIIGPHPEKWTHR